MFWSWFGEFLLVATAGGGEVGVTGSYPAPRFYLVYVNLKEYGARLS
jgi:hypothetical protein